MRVPITRQREREREREIAAVAGKVKTYFICCVTWCFTIVLALSMPQWLFKHSSSFSVGNTNGLNKWPGCMSACPCVMSSAVAPIALVPTVH